VRRGTSHCFIGATAGNAADQTVLTACLAGLRHLHETLDANEAERRRKAERTLVRDGGSWSEQLELDLDAAGYHTIISLPLGHGAAEVALEAAAGRGAMKKLAGATGGGPRRPIAHQGGGA
jgi:hypothetical protein